jgi:integrase/recombinase XerD
MFWCKFKMTVKNTQKTEMRLFDDAGKRLYLNKSECELLQAEFRKLDKYNRMFFETLYFTGCRPIEVLGLTRARVNFDDRVLVVRTAKQRKVDMQGNINRPKHRAIPVPNRLLDDLELAFDIRQLMRNQKNHDKLLWSKNRSTYYRNFKVIADKLKIVGPQATLKGLRHAYGIRSIEMGVPLHIVSELMGHSDIQVTTIYLQAMGDEKRKLAAMAWGGD